ncbi:MAG: oxygen-independent coproporphyrinogen III oxidase [Gammaproteobacteria bacterium]|jgi:oxygen-independent coproporphyrinogen-3 oxidase|nr:oxygen-independent coproporphyrinogen III oxidase [Gammaproteobacteria bacterium]MBT3723473.1 oxygen-independent coproporphyrinogen III oxidase [Gammaproteobacteria bacterium]MBT4076613.1 oxygen-independent coproporphyrinogen III oxidase [Gammaproteobacteria bacterium]MBT4194319.1 oxygen-independent coproporphyrinogen III oxidase [Gammaproteobacteria bacterium]MBT4450873.1 oxygen-independent coproporphyrinogen III oxidase [Gammaproteobacteria bacterium]
MVHKLDFDPGLIKKYDKSGPRYTSYPTAPQFSTEYTADTLKSCIERSNREIIPAPLSLYIHIPYCDTICYYCACNKIITKNHTVSNEYLDLLEAEMQMISPLFDKDRELEQLHLGGGTPTFLNDEELMDLIRRIEDNFTFAKDCEMSIEIDPRKVSNETLELLTNIGFNRISLGVQDFDEKVQLAVNRVQSYELVRDRLETCRRLNIKSINMDLIYGLPFQSVETFERTLDKVIELRPDRLSIFNYAHLPERFKPQRRINDEDLPTPAEKLKIFELTMNKLQEAGYVYIGMDHFALEDDSMVKAQQEGSLQRNFQGYSTHAHTDLVAIGVSSIGSIFDSYSQNSSNIDDYREMVLAGKLPIVRGLVMNNDDLLRKQVINQLICHFDLEITKFEEQWNIDFKEYFKSEMKQLDLMVEDGLVKVDEKSIKVETRGRLLIRNICMVFDNYLKDNVVKFSKVI